MITIRSLKLLLIFKILNYYKKFHLILKKKDLKKQIVSIVSSANRLLVVLQMWPAVEKTLSASTVLLSVYCLSNTHK